jgi:hypothetical protein
VSWNAGAAMETILTASFTFRIQISDYNKGESFRIEVVSEDESIYAADTVFPFPLVARDGQCQVWAELVTENRKNYALWGSGFLPGETVHITSTDGYDPRAWTETLNHRGMFMAAVAQGRSDGTAVFSVPGQRCKVSLTYDFGRRAKGPQ